MPNQLLEINDFGGIVNDETTQGTKGFVDVLGLDLWSEDGICQINKRLEAETTTGMITASLSHTIFDGKIISGNEDAELWYEGTANTWTLLHTNTNNGDNNDLITYQDYLIYSSNSKLGRSVDKTIAGGFDDNPTWGSGSTFSNGTSADEHYFKIYNNRLYISDGNFLAELDGTADPTDPTTWIFTAEKFKLPVGETIKSLEVIGGYLAMGTSDGNFYTWDGASDNSSQIIKTTLGGINAMIQLNNTLLVFAGVHGTVYQYNGANFDPVIQIPNFNTDAGTYVRKPAVRKYKNGIIFCVHDNGIFIYNRNKAGERYKLVKYGNMSGGKIATDSLFYSIFLTSTSAFGEFIVGYENSGTYSIDRTSGSGDRYRMEEAGSGDTTAAPYFETFVYELRDDKGKPNRIQGVQGLFKDDGTDVNNNIMVEYRLNNDTTYTELGSIGEDGYDIDTILRGIGKRASKVQFKIKFGRESNTILGVQNTKLTNLKIF